MISKIKKLSLFLVPFLFLSCLDISYDITVKDDLSGKIKVNLVLDKVTASLIDTGKEDKLPDTKEKVLKNETDNLKLLNFSKTEDEDYKKINYSFSFTKISDLLSILKSNDMDNSVSITKQGDDNVLSYDFLTKATISKRNKELGELSSDQRDLIETILVDYSMKFNLHLPSKIKSSNMGKINGKNLTYSVTLDKLVLEKNPIKLKVVF